MTNSERARKIYDQLLKPETSLEWCDPVDFIAAQLDEVEREAVKRELQERLLNLQDSKAYADGFRAAQEKAAELVMLSDEEDGTYVISKRVQEMKP